MVRVSAVESRALSGWRLHGAKMNDKRPLRARHRPNRTDFSKFVAGLPRPVGRLGLTHVTTGYLAREIVEARKIVALENCPVLNEPVVYAFYGRTAFRQQKDQQTSDLHFMFPVLLLLDPHATPAPKYLFPCDSGAFVSRFLDEFLDPNMPLFDFLLEPHVENAAALANYFFGDGDRFLKNQHSAEASVSASNFEASSYLRMVKAAGSSNILDDRTSTPELVFEDPIPIEKCVRAAILPDILASDPEIGDRLRSFGVVVREYLWRSGSRPAEYHMLIRSMVDTLYADFGWEQ